MTSSINIEDIPRNSIAVTLLAAVLWIIVFHTMLPVYSLHSLERKFCC